MVIIKKYSNRRLYDTDQSRYITLDELAERIRDGVYVKVVDAKSGRDLTQGTLAQIILESRGAAKLLPVSLLVRLIRLGDDALAEFMGPYLSWSLEVFLRFQQGARAVTKYTTLPWRASEWWLQDKRSPMDIMAGLGPWLSGPPQKREGEGGEESALMPVDEKEAQLESLRQELKDLRDMVEGHFKGDGKSPGKKE